MKKEISFVIPCLNEANSLSYCIEKAKRFLEENNIIGEIIVADNGSTDGSQNIATNHGARVVSITEKGYGSALRGGILAAEGQYIIMGDADDSYNFYNVMPFISKLREGFDLVMGNRFKGGIEKGAMPFLHKYLGNPVLSFVGRLFFKSNIRDFHCGLRAFTKEAFVKMDTHTTGMEFASEMVVKAHLLNLKITEVPTTLSKDKRGRKPHLNTWSDGWRHLRFLLLYSPKWLFLFPGIFLIVSGLFSYLLLSIKPLQISHIVLDVHTLLYIETAIIIGIQFVLFYGLTKIYAVENNLLPKSVRYESLFEKINLEKGLLLGCFLIIIGFILGFINLLKWLAVDFGNLNVTDTLRIAIPSSFFIIIGTELILFSFFFSILGLKKSSDNFAEKN